MGWEKYKTKTKENDREEDEERKEDREFEGTVGRSDGGGGRGTRWTEGDEKERDSKVEEGRKVENKIKENRG